MAHYRLIYEYTTPEFHNVCGRVFDEDGNEVAVIIREPIHTQKTGKYGTLH